MGAFTRVLAACVPLAAAQSAAPSPWDAIIATCTEKTTLGAALTVSQTSATTVSIGHTGFSPSMVWLANEEGTVIAFSNSVSGSSTTLSFAGKQPFDVQPFSCPPPANLAPALRAWKGVYEDTLAMCCAEEKPTQSQVNSYGPRLTLSWNSQRVRVRANAKAPLLNYAMDSEGILQRVDEGGGTGSYDAWASFTPLATSVMACALLTDGAINPVCAELSLVENIASDLEAGGANPVAKLSLEAFGATVSYAGTANAPVATFDVAARNSSSCVLYARNITASGTPVAAFSNSSSLSVDLATVSAALTLYACCGVSVSASGRPVRCPSGALFSTTIDVTSLKSTAATYFAQALTSSSAGTLSFSATTAARCGGAYKVGDSILNATGTMCTCVAGATSFDEPVWNCDAIPPMASMGLHGSQVALVVALPTLVLVLGCVCLGTLKFMQGGGRYKMPVEIHMPAEPADASGLGKTRHHMSGDV